MSYQFNFETSRADYERLFELVKGREDVRIVAVRKSLLPAIEIADWRSIIDWKYANYLKIMLYQDYLNAKFVAAHEGSWHRYDLEDLPVVEFTVPADYPDARELRKGRFYFIPESYERVDGGFALKPEHSIRWAKNLMARVRRHCTKIERRWVFGEHAMELVKQGYRMK